ncbi:ABC transporter permease [Chitinophaga sp. Cy-1792]|uniref:ABC transporter permease n=1 Tax=Chitinophaga sp. Cy-1792 TaxID=2608339 RepID=UPI0014220AD8|nr:ABC transporter permease [Chitinophaga sp. Cy-1792]NIG53038.1 FtsX-like permease family protein [Chitinophaga sp. Cy-1792]
MLRNYFKVAIRNLLKNKPYAIINIVGLTSGIVTVLLIGLWINDEWQFNKQFANYKQVAQVYQQTTANGNIGVGNNMPFPVAPTLRSDFGDYFKQVALCTWVQTVVLSKDKKNLSANGIYAEQGLPDMLQLAVSGNKQLSDPNSILLSASQAKACFGNENPINKTLITDGGRSVTVAGTYPDFPVNSEFGMVKFIMPWQRYANMQHLAERENPWRSNSYRVFVQIADNTTMDKVSQVIKDVKLNHIHADEKTFQPQLFLHPMARWHLYSKFTNGVNSGGPIQYLWLLGVSGLFILLLACINFMNLSTARSEKRAKEVGIRKAIGSRRAQLAVQFFTESLIMSMLAMVISILIVQQLLPLFNTITDKAMHMPWNSAVFWGTILLFCMMVALIAGSYPAFYLSSFRPVKVLKGTFHAAKGASMPRRILLVTQFTVAMVLLVATMVVYRQVKLGTERPVGYEQHGLIIIPSYTAAIHDHFDAVKQQLLESNAALDMAESWSPVTAVWNTNSGFKWEGRDMSVALDFPNEPVSYDYGHTIGWQFVAGRDFSRDFASDSAAFVINEAAAKYMGLKAPVGAKITWDDEPYHIVGIVKNVVAESPYEPARPAFYHLNSGQGTRMLVRLNPAMGVSTALKKVESIYAATAPDDPFDYAFADNDYNMKFGAENRFAKLVGIFSCLAVFISCIGLFGMASYIVEQRTKEIGVRKVLGASVFSLWRLLSRDFVRMILIAMPMAFGLAGYCMHNWLQNYSYRAGLAWWIFALSGLITLVLTIIVVSVQAVKAATQQPLKSLQS